MVRWPAACTLLLLLTACGGKSTDDTSSSTDDTGTDDTGDTQVNYDPGCITVDGEGGYASLNYAISVASEGSTIAICEGNFEEEVLVNKDVTIVGAGADLTSWSAPTNTHSFTVEDATAVTIQDLTIGSTRSAVKVETGAGITVSGLNFENVGNYGVESNNASNTAIENSTFVGCDYGGVLVNGGAASISDNSFTNLVAFAIKGTSDAVVEISNNEISGTTYSEIDKKGSVSDGFAIWMEDGAAASMSGNTLTDNAIVSIYGYDSPGALTMDGDSVTGGVYGLYWVLGGASLTDVEILDAEVFGIYYVTNNTSQTLALDGTTISGDPKVVTDMTYADIDEGYIGSCGIFFTGTNLEMNNSLVEGYNTYGSYIQSYNGDGGTAIVTDSTWSNNGRHGVMFIAMDVDASNTSVVDLREVETPEVVYVNRSGAAIFNESTVSWTGGEISNNAGWGFSNVYGSAILTPDKKTGEGTTFSNNLYSSVMDYNGTTYLSGATFTEHGSAGSYPGVYIYYSSDFTLTENTFADHVGEYSYSYTSGHDEHTVVYSGRGNDVNVYGADATVSDNTFSNGDQALYVNDGTLTVTGNTWSGYNGGLVQAYYATLNFSDNVADSSSGYTVYGYDSDVEIENFTLTNSVNRHYDYSYYLNDETEPYSTGTSDYPLDAFYFSSSTGRIENVTIETSTGHAATFSDSNVEIDTFTITDSGSEESSGDSVYAYWSSTAPEFYIDGLTIDGGTNGGGLFIWQNNTEDAVIELENVSINETSGDGLTLTSLSSVTLTDVSSTNNAECTGSDCVGNGIVISSSTVSGSNVTATGNSEYGLSITGGSVNITSATASSNTLSGALLSSASTSFETGEFSSNGEYGLESTDGTLVLKSSDVSNNGFDGLTVSGTTVTATENTFSNNAEYGMSCDGTETIDSCSNEMLGNGLGDYDGCQSCE